MPVVVLHGSPANRKTCLSLARVRPAGVVLFAPDLPGHGSRRDEPFTIAAALAAVSETLALAGGRAIVAGDSLGGYVALAAGARLPGVAAVVASGCTFEMRGAASALALASDLPLQLALRLAGEARLEALAGRILSRAIDPETARAVAAAGLRLAARGESIRELARLRAADLVRTCRVPIVFVNGSRDWPTRSGEGRFRRLAARSELVLAPRTPHGVSVLAPATFARAIDVAVTLAAP